jgi:molybdopterin-guanine dinucleotide biosynthesis protein A
MCKRPGSKQDPAVRTKVPDVPKTDITGVILAGGRSRRMGGQDKGLLCIDGRPLVVQVIDAVRPQVGSLLINANRNLDRYRALGYPLVTDLLEGYLGPLAGMASAMQATVTPYCLFVPCDSPLVPSDLCARLYHDLEAAGADVSVAHDGHRMHPVLALLRRALLPDLLDYLGKGRRKTGAWYREHRLVLSDFSDRPEGFLNINRAEDLAALETSGQGAEAGSAGTA